MYVEKTKMKFHSLLYIKQFCPALNENLIINVKFNCLVYQTVILFSGLFKTNPSRTNSIHLFVHTLSDLI